MGLDMFAFTVPADIAGDVQVDIKVPEHIKREELAYWRKFNHLHGWMSRLYYAKGGKDPEFNCNTVRITNDDLDKLYQDASNNNLPTTVGFFFGGSELYPEDIEDLIAFIGKAKRAIAEGKVVFYDSWW